MRMLLLDMDNCAAGHVWPPFQPIDKLVYSEMLRLCAERDVTICSLTNRPAAQHGLVSPIFGSQFHLCESGLSAWIPNENRMRINPRYVEYSETVHREIMRRLTESYQLSPQAPRGIVAEAGGRAVSVCIFPLPMCADDPAVPSVEQLLGEITELLRDLPCVVRHALGVDIFPAAGTSATKVTAFEWLPELYQEFYGEFHPSQFLYIDDSIPEVVARYVREHLPGLTIGAPGNSAEATKAAVRGVGGWLADAPMVEGCLELIRRWLGVV